MAECVFAHTSRTKVLGREHASCRHNADKGVEGRFSRVLRKNIISLLNSWSFLELTIHLSSDAARAPELDTSSFIPFLFSRIS